jgi:hypothetical protein
LAYGSSNHVGEDEYGESTKKFTQVGATDNNLGPGADTESTLGVDRGEGVLQEPMEIESQSVTGEEPCQTDG